MTAVATGTEQHSSPAASVVSAAILGFTAGFVDTTGFIALFGLFTAHVTGNFVLIGVSIAEHHPGILAKLLALPVFVLVVAVTHLAAARLQARGQRAASVVLGAQLLMLAAFLAAGLSAAPFPDADAPNAIATGLIGVAAMAIQNAASRTLFASLAPTTVMTGNVTQLIIDLVDLTAGRPDAAARKSRLAKMWPPVATFALGALVGGLGYAALGFWCLLAPILAIAGAIWINRR